MNNETQKNKYSKTLFYLILFFEIIYLIYPAKSVQLINKTVIGDCEYVTTPNYKICIDINQTHSYYGEIASYYSTKYNESYSLSQQYLADYIKLVKVSGVNVNSYFPAEESAPAGYSILENGTTYRSAIDVKYGTLDLFWYIYPEYYVGRIKTTSITNDEGLLIINIINDTNSISGDDLDSLNHVYGPKADYSTITQTSSTSYDIYDSNNISWIQWNGTDNLELSRILNKMPSGATDLSSELTDSEPTGPDYTIQEFYNTNIDNYDTFFVISSFSNDANNIYSLLTNPASISTNGLNNQFNQKEFIYEMNMTGLTTLYINVTGNPNWKNTTEKLYFKIYGTNGNETLFDDENNPVLCKDEIEHYSDYSIFAITIQKNETKRLILKDIDINQCTIITDEGTYILRQNIIDSSNQTCFDIRANNVLFDCHGFRVDGLDNDDSYAFYSVGHNNVTLENCNITDWAVGVYGQGGSMDINNVSVSSIDGLITAYGNSYPVLSYFNSEFVINNSNIQRATSYGDSSFIVNNSVVNEGIWADITNNLDIENTNVLNGYAGLSGISVGCVDESGSTASNKVNIINTSVEVSNKFCINSSNIQLIEEHSSFGNSYIYVSNQLNLSGSRGNNYYINGFGSANIYLENNQVNSFDLKNFINSSILSNYVAGLSINESVYDLIDKNSFNGDISIDNSDELIINNSNNTGNLRVTGGIISIDNYYFNNSKDAINIYDSNGLTINNSLLYSLDKTAYSGIIIKNVTNYEISNTKIFNVIYGFKSTNASYGKIDNLTVINCGADCIKPQSGHDLIINNSYVENSGNDGIFLWDIKNVKIMNTLSKNVLYQCFDGDKLENIEYYNLYGEDCKHVGIYFNPAINTSVHDCVINKSGEGYRVSDGYGMDSYNNSFYNNKLLGVGYWRPSGLECYGIRIGSLVNNSLVYNNKIWNNYVELVNETCLGAIDNGVNNYWNTTKTLETNIIGGPYIGGNYWSDYTGYDTNGDGIGDTSTYHINPNSIDYLPLTTTPLPDNVKNSGISIIILLIGAIMSLLFISSIIDPSHSIIKILLISSAMYLILIIEQVLISVVDDSTINKLIQLTYKISIYSIIILIFFIVLSAITGIKWSKQEQ